MKQEEQYLEVHRMPGEYLHIFQETGISKVCCLSSSALQVEPMCQPLGFIAPDEYAKLVKSLPNPAVAWTSYNFTYNAMLNEVPPFEINLRRRV